jgi:hypothetical protein
VARAINTAREGKVFQRAFPALEPSKNAGPRGFEKLELDWSLGLLLNDHRPVSNSASYYQVSDSNSDEIATPQLAVDCEIEERTIPNPMVLVEQEADRPNLLWFERPLSTELPTHIPCRPFHLIK